AARAQRRPARRGGPGPEREHRPAQRTALRAAGVRAAGPPLTRLAFLTPLPPASTGIADYSAEVLALLAPRYEIDVFHAQDAVDGGRLPAGCGVHHASTFLTRHREQPYALAIHQLGNGPAHDFVYPFLPQLPGLVVLHDLVLHHARARMFLDTPEARA